MARTKRYFLFAFAVVFVSTVLYFLSEYQRQPAAVTDLKTDVNISASQLIEAFEKNESAANESYLGKVLEVNGPVAGIQNQGDTTMNITLGQPANIHNISCLLLANDVGKAGRLQNGDVVTVKGICTGYLMDVELNRCMIVK